MELIDTHVHINFDSFDEDRDEMMQRAYDMGISKMLHACCTFEEMPNLIKHAESFDGGGKPDLYHGLGVHPTNLDNWNEDSIQKLEKEVKKTLGKKLRAIGETGLDYYHEKEDFQIERQKKAFREQINLAKKYKLPIIVHTRDAWEDTLEILESEYENQSEKMNGVMHCYTGDLKYAQKFIDLGFFISWSGVLTYKNAPAYRETAKQIPIEKTVIETDCPFLAPQAKRGKRNEPSFVNYVAECLATVYDLPLEEVAKKTTENAKKLFNL